jgi:hypothetical protein
LLTNKVFLKRNHFKSLLMFPYYEKEVVTMLNKGICVNANAMFIFVASNSIFMSKTLYDSPTLMETIFS